MKTAVKVIERFYIRGDNSDEDSCESNIKVLYRGITLMKSAVKVILRFYIGVSICVDQGMKTDVKVHFYLVSDRLEFGLY